METSIQINKALVKRLIVQQFPQFCDLEIYSVKNQGHDNRTFHLGRNCSVRLPTNLDYAQQIQKENRWLPYLQEFLDYPISQPMAIGLPSLGFPYPWSINKWVKGATLSEDLSVDKKRVAIALASALKKLQNIDCRAGPFGGQHNFFRGCHISTYNQDTIAALDRLKNSLPTAQLLKIWQNCCASTFTERKVWVHGDVAPGNVIAQNHIFYGLIDFGGLGIGDPACDYAMAWSYFDEQSRILFLKNLDEGLIQRARGWALWKALITFNDDNFPFRKRAEYTINAILNED